MRTVIALITVLAMLFGSGAVYATDNERQDTVGEKTQTVNPVVFWELACHDAGESIAFFESVFDWRIKELPNTILKHVESRANDRGIDGGIFTLQKARLPFLTVYILVDDIEEKARLIEKSGGFIVEPPHEIASGSWICLFNDPSGVTFAMLQQMRGDEDSEENDSQ